MTPTLITLLSLAQLIAPPQPTRTCAIPLKEVHAPANPIDPIARPIPPPGRITDPFRRPPTRIIIDPIAHPSLIKSCAQTETAKPAVTILK